MNTTRRFALTLGAAACVALGTVAPVANANPVTGKLIETVVFKGPAKTTPMSFTGLGEDKDLVQPDGEFNYSAPGDESTDLCTAKDGITGGTRDCTITISGRLTSTKVPGTDIPVHGPVCDRTTGVDGTGELRVADRVYKLSNVTWPTSAGGSVITGDWTNQDGESGTLTAPVNTRRGLACANPEGTEDFSVSGTALFYRNNA